MNPNLDYEYVLGGTVPLYSANYVKRIADQQIYEALLRKQFCYVFNSRQMGKSSLRVRTTKALESQNIDCVNVDLQGAISRGMTAQEWYRDLTDTIIEELSLEFDIDDWLQNHHFSSPMRNFRDFIHEVLLPHTTKNIIFFIDEIDSILKVDFKNEFFGLIRFFYNKRAENLEYQRISFVLIGVATPADLIGEENELPGNFSPFNIGEAIDLQGFKLNEVQPLENGLIDHTDNPHAVLEAILFWTGGQPFLTQKLCQTVRDVVNHIASSNEKDGVQEGNKPFLTQKLCRTVRNVGNRIANNTEKDCIRQIVQSGIIDQWESKDDQEHLRTIRDRLKSKPKLTIAILSLYQKILNGDKVLTDSSPEKMELMLSGIVSQQNGRLIVSNSIYKEIFNLAWVEEMLVNDRPYAPALAKWNASQHQDQSCLLQGKELSDVLQWAENKNLGSQDSQFLQASQNLQLSNAQRKTKQQMVWGIIISGLTLVGAITLTSIGTRFSKISTLNALAQNFLSVNAIPEALLASLTAARLTTEATGINALVNLNSQQTKNTLQQVIDTRLLKGNEGEVYSVTFSPQQLRIAAAGEDKNVRIWNLNGKEIGTISKYNKEVSPNGHKERIWTVRFSPNGQTIATASWDGTVKLWHQPKLQKEWELSKSEKESEKEWELLQVLEDKKDNAGKVFGVSFSSDGQQLVSIGQNGMVRLWSWDKPKSEYTLIDKWKIKSNKLITNAVSVSFSPDAKTIATANDNGDEAMLWEVRDGKYKLSITLSGSKGEGKGEVNSISFSPDGKKVVTTNDDQKARIWDLKGNLLQILEGHQGKIMSANFSPDGKTIATASFDKTVKLWNVDNGKEKPSTFPLHPGWVWDVSFSPDGKFLASTGRDGMVRLWPINNDKSQPPEITDLLKKGCSTLNGYLQQTPKTNVYNDDEEKAKTVNYCQEVTSQQQK